MEEADVLGDRIAIMDHGRLVCYGSSMFLKKEYGKWHFFVIITFCSNVGTSANVVFSSNKYFIGLHSEYSCIIGLEKRHTESLV